MDGGISRGFRREGSKWENLERENEIRSNELSTKVGIVLTEQSSSPQSGSLS